MGATLEQFAAAAITGMLSSDPRIESSTSTAEASA
jgi:hypothetical protein